jgi:hypothetical protein
MVFEFALVACLLAVTIGALSNSASKAALYSGLGTAFVAFSASLVPSILIRSIETEAPLEGAMIQALAVMPAAMAVGLVGHGMRWGLGRLMPRKPSGP